MNKFFLLCIVLLITLSLVAQERIKKTATAPDIDGFSEDIWEQAKPYPIDKPFKTEAPTVTATWQALYDDENFYVLVTVEDDDHWPGWEANGESTQYDMTEIFWDVNEVLDDGKGAKDVGSGHYLFAESFEDGYYDIPLYVIKDDNNPGGIFAYSLIGEGYIYELAVPLINFKNISGVSFGSIDTRNMGFDVTIIDQDKDITTTPHRMVWSNDGVGNNGSTDESWNNMDGAGELRLNYYSPAVSVASYKITIWNFPERNKATVNIRTNKQWAAVSNQTWLVVSPETGTGKGMLTLSATENTGGTRTANVTIKLTSGTQAIFNVTQYGTMQNHTTTENRVKVSPNPTTDKMLVEDGVDTVELFNSLGKIVKITSVNGKTVSVAELPNGIYMVKAYKKEQFVGMAKIIKN
jgi:hypothetical protein